MRGQLLLPPKVWSSPKAGLGGAPHPLLPDEASQEAAACFQW